MIFLHDVARASRRLNTLVLALASLWLLASLVLAHMQGLPASPLHELQRAALVMAGVGLTLNMRLGPSPLHYAMVVAAALGMLAAGGWVLLQGGPGAAVLAGWRAETWFCAAALGLLLFAVPMLAADRKWGDNALKKPVAWPGALVMGLFLVAALALAANAGMADGWGGLAGL